MRGIISCVTRGVIIIIEDTIIMAAWEFDLSKRIADFEGVHIVKDVVGL